LDRGHEAQFIDDQELLAGEVLLQAEQATLVSGFHHLVDE
jgi:hypothetical protein